MPITEPFLKWPGGKRRLVPLLCAKVSWPVKRLVEPFCGSAAFGLSMADMADSVWLNDINRDLMNLFEAVAFHSEALMQVVSALFVPENNTPEQFYYLRDLFNKESDPLQRAALFIYLNRHGYNGLCRFNSSGKFNVPFGRYKHPRFPVAELLKASLVLRKARLTALDFTDVLAQCGDGDLVYCDPPYMPLSVTASFTSYAPAPFGQDEQIRLAACAEKAARRGATVIVSNHDTPATRKLYEKAIVDFVKVRRNISCKGQKRESAAEVIAVFRP